MSRAVPVSSSSRSLLMTSVCGSLPELVLTSIAARGS